MESSVQDQVSQSQKQVSLFRPYCAAAPGSNHLREAMAMFCQGQLMGARQMEGGQPIPFSLQWQPGQLPADPCPCTLAITPIPGACYRFSVPSYQAVLWLLEVCRSGAAATDMPQTFWNQLFSA